jgi:hypothetical protein
MTDEPNEYAGVKPSVTVHVNVYPIGVPGRMAITVETSPAEFDITREEVIRVLERGLAGMRDTSAKAWPWEFLGIYRPPR